MIDAGRRDGRLANALGLPAQLRPDRRSVAAQGLLVAILMVMLTGAGAVMVRLSGPADAASAWTMATTGSVRPSGEPVSVRIPAIGVDVALVPLGLDPEGALAVPPYDRAGWYEGGPRPGQRGPAVIAAHVDSTTGPAVFYRLRDLKPGDAVHVDYADGTSVGFRARSTGRYPKSAFPTAQVYGPTDAPELRLITCTGAFDRRTHSYQENLVVRADADGHRRAH